MSEDQTRGLARAAGNIHGQTMRQLLSGSGEDLAQQALAYLQSEGLVTLGESQYLSRLRDAVTDTGRPDTTQELYSSLLHEPQTSSVALMIAAIAADSMTLPSGEDGSGQSGAPPSGPPQNISLADVDGAMQGAAIGAGIAGEHGAVIGGIVGGAIRSAAAKRG